jgi:hypothetical protein
VKALNGGLLPPASWHFLLRSDIGDFISIITPPDLPPTVLIYSQILTLATVNPKDWLLHATGVNTRKAY